LRFINPFKKRSEEPSENGIDRFFSEVSGGALTAGVRVNSATAQKLAAVYACVQAISETFAMLPVSVIQEVDDRTKNKLKNHPLYPVLHNAPNPFMDSFQFFEKGTADTCEDGDFICHVDRDSSDTVLALTPLEKSGVTIEVGSMNRLKYKYKAPNEPEKIYDQHNIFHLKHRTKDGVWGRSPIMTASESMGFAIAVQQHGNKSFQQGLWGGGFIESPVVLKSDDARKRLIESVVGVLSGVKNTGKTGLLEGGVKYVPRNGQSNRDAQLLELMKAGILDIARIFRMPPNMIQFLEQGASFASVEQMSINFVTYTLGPWITRWERALKRQLCDPVAEQDIFLKFNEKALLRGDLVAQTNALVQQTINGLKTLNEARDILDENPIEHPLADQIMVSQQVRPLDQLKKEIEAPTESAPKDEPVQEDKEPVLNAFQDLITERFDKLIAQEQKSVKRLRDKPTFVEDLSEFYEKHKKLMRQELDAISKAFCRSVKIEFVEERVRIFVDDFLETRVCQISEFRNSGSDSIESWDKESKNYAKSLLDKVINRG